MTKSRIKNTKNNIITGIIYQLVSILFPFLSRTAILYFLGEQYVGVSSLIASILQVLNLAELGFSSAIIYSMYKPIHEGDTETICALLSYYRRIYITVGIIFASLGLLILPFITFLIKGTWPREINIYIVYCIYLLDTGISYFLFGYKSALLTALQRSDVINNTRSFVNVIRYILEIIIIILFKNYYAYILMLGLSTIVNNIVINFYTNKHYPDFQCKGIIEPQIKKNIKKQVSGLLVCNVGDKFRNSFDTLILSALFGLTAVTIFSNYFYIFTAVSGVMYIIIQSMQASVGDCIVSKTKEENFLLMRRFQFIFFWINCWFSACLVSLYQPFMLLWAGQDLLLSTKNMLLFCVYFYVLHCNDIRNLYFNGNGLWWASKLSFILEAVFNLLLNVILGTLWGVSGILIATILTVLVFNFIQRTNILFIHYFGFGKRRFFFEHLLYIFITIFVCIITGGICNLITISGIWGFLIKIFVCVCIPNLLLLIIFFKGSNFKFITKLLCRIKN